MFSTSQPPLKSSLSTVANNRYSLVVEPLLPGFGYTLGNSLRRILLSAVPGFAVTKIKINDITHEYQPIEGVVEDALEVVLNLKNIRAKILNTDEKVVINLKKTGNCDVFAGDFETGGKVQIVNQDLYICSLNKDAELDIELEISRGSGYLSVEKLNLGANPNPQYMIVDALFSPVTNVNIEVEQVRVGEMINFDKLTLNFESDGTIDGKEIADFALELNIELLQKIKSSLESSSLTGEKAPIEDKEISQEIKITAKKILSILEKAGIMTDEQLKNANLEEINGLDEKMVSKIKEYLAKL